MISVLILTKNEEQDLPACLASVAWSDDVHVFDSYSTDRTVLIAERAGATVTQRTFDSYARQRNAALTTLPFKHKWLLILDADERIPEMMARNLQTAVRNAPASVNGFRMERRDYLGQSWLKHTQMTAIYIRLVRVGRARYHREINEVLEVEGEVRQLNSYFEHYPFSKGFAHWLNKHNVYSTMEARQWVSEHRGNARFSLQKALFSSDFSEKRYHQKGLFYKVPGRPLIKWTYLYVIKRGFLDGRAGLIVATLQAIYEYFIVIKTDDLLRREGSRSAGAAGVLLTREETQDVAAPAGRSLRGAVDM